MRSRTSDPCDSLAPPSAESLCAWQFPSALAPQSPLRDALYLLKLTLKFHHVPSNRGHDLGKNNCMATVITTSTDISQKQDVCDLVKWRGRKIPIEATIFFDALSARMRSNVQRLDTNAKHY